MFVTRPKWSLWFLVVIPLFILPIKKWAEGGEATCRSLTMEELGQAAPANPADLVTMENIQMGILPEPKGHFQISFQIPNVPQTPPPAFSGANVKLDSVFATIRSTTTPTPIIDPASGHFLGEVQTTVVDRSVTMNLLVSDPNVSEFSIFPWLGIRAPKRTAGVVCRFTPLACAIKQEEAKKIDDEIYKIGQRIDEANIKITSKVEFVNLGLKSLNDIEKERTSLDAEINNITRPGGILEAAQNAYEGALTAATGTMDQQTREQVEALARQFGKTFEEAVQMYLRQEQEKLKQTYVIVNGKIQTYNNVINGFNAFLSNVKQYKSDLQALLDDAVQLEKWEQELKEKKRAIQETLGSAPCILGPDPKIPAIADGSTGEIPVEKESKESIEPPHGLTEEPPPLVVSPTQPPPSPTTETPPTPPSELPPLSEDEDLVTLGPPGTTTPPILDTEGGIAPSTSLRPPRQTPYEVMSPPDLSKTGLDFNRYTATEGTTELVSLGFRGVESQTLIREELGETARIIFGTLIPGFSTQVEVQEKLAGSWADALNMVLFTTLFNLTNTIVEGEVSPSDVVAIRNAALAGDETEVRNILNRLGGTHPPEGAAEGIVDDFISEIMRVGAMTQPGEVVSLAPRMLTAIKAMNNADLTIVLMNLCITANLILRAEEAAKIERVATVGIVLAPIGVGAGSLGALAGLGKAGQVLAQAAGQAVASAGSLAYSSSEVIRIGEEIERERVHIASGTGDPDRLASLEFERDLSILFAAVDVVFLGFDVTQVGLATKAHILTREAAEAIRAAKEATADAVRNQKMALAKTLAARLSALLEKEARFALFEFKTFAVITGAQVAIAAASGNPAGAILPLAILGIRGGTAAVAARAARSQGTTVDAGAPVTVTGQQGTFEFVRLEANGQIVLRRPDGGLSTFASGTEVLTTSGATPILPGSAVTVSGERGEFVFVGRNEFGDIVLRGEAGEITVPPHTEIAASSAKRGPTATAKDLKEGKTKITIEGREGEFIVIEIKPGKIKVMEAQEGEADPGATIALPRVFSFDPDLVKFRIVPEGEASQPPPPSRRTALGLAVVLMAFEPGTIVRTTGEDAEFIVQGTFPDGRVLIRDKNAPIRDSSEATIDNTRLIKPEELTVVPPRAPAGEETVEVPAPRPPVEEGVAPPPRTAEQQARSRLLGILQPELALRIETDAAGREFVQTPNGETIFLGQILGIGTEGVVFRINTVDGNPTNEVLKINKFRSGSPEDEARVLERVASSLPVSRVTDVIRDADGKVVALKKEFIPGSTLSRIFKEILALTNSQDPENLAKAAKLRESVSIAVGSFFQKMLVSGETNFDLIPANLIVREGSCDLVLIDAGGLAVARSFSGAEDFFQKVATEGVGGFGLEPQTLEKVFNLDTVRRTLGVDEAVPSCPAPAPAGFEGLELDFLLPK